MSPDTPLPRGDSLRGTPRILIVNTYYSEFLHDLYAHDSELADLDYEEQQRRVLATAFCVSDAYSLGLRACGWEAVDVIVNADRLQARWAAENGLRLSGDIHDQRRQVIEAQVEQLRPDVLFVFEWCPLGDAFLARMKSRVRLLVGQIASPLPSNRTFTAYDLMISSWPPIVEHFRREGIDAAPLRLGFDHRVWDRLRPQPPLYDVTFVGGFAPSHVDRIAWLERLLVDINIDIFGYGIERVPQHSPIRKQYRGQAWGWRMYDVLQRSRITLNRHARIDVRGQAATNVANNMRLYEATGVGTCLMTEQKDNLHELFEPGREVVAYEDEADCVEKIRYYLEHEPPRQVIAQAGRQRTLRDHTYADRMKELGELLYQQVRV